MYRMCKDGRSLGAFAHMPGMRDHTLLQAITRTNRTFGDKKTHGLIVDYLGVFDDVAKSLEFDEAGFRQVISDNVNLKTKLPEAMQKCLA